MSRGGSEDVWRVSLRCLKNVVRVSGDTVKVVLSLNRARQVRPSQVRSGQVRRGQIRTGEVRTGPFRKVQVKTGKVRTQPYLT